VLPGNVSRAPSLRSARFRGRPSISSYTQ